MHEYIKRLEQLVSQIHEALATLKLEAKMSEVLTLEQEMLVETFWNDRERAEYVSSRVKQLQDLISTWRGLDTEVSELREMATILTEEDPETKELAERVNALEAQFEELSTVLYLNEVHDERGAYVSITSGMGGLDAEEFVHMLVRMYSRFCEDKGWKVEVYEKHDNNQGGCKAAHLEVHGAFAYGLLKAERGVHRLVRLSPFKSSDSRQTSFAGVEVLPIIQKADHIAIKTEDLRIDTFRASGAGGQHVNTTDSAVRITHLPTGIVVSCQNERSQGQNKERAMNLLQAKLQEHLEAEQAKEEAALRGTHLTAEWGNQIRSYVLHPYKQVKDHRTDFESKDPDSVLDGALQGFIDAWLRWRKR